MSKQEGLLTERDARFWFAIVISIVALFFSYQHYVIQQTIAMELQKQKTVLINYRQVLKTLMLHHK